MQIELSGAMPISLVSVSGSQGFENTWKHTATSQEQVAASGELPAAARAGAGEASLVCRERNGAQGGVGQRQK